MRGIMEMALTGRSMPTSITLNSITVNPVAAYCAKNASSSSLIATFGTDLVISGTGPGIMLNIPTGLKNRSDRIGMTFSATANAQYYSATSTSYLDIDGTSDYVVEYIFNTNGFGIGENCIFGKGNGGGNGMLAYTFQHNLKGLGILNIGSASVSLQSNTWYHVLQVVKRGGNCRTYLNGILTASSPANFVANSNLFKFNEYNIHSSPGCFTTPWLAIWSATSLAGGSVSEIDALAASRFALI